MSSRALLLVCVAVASLARPASGADYYFDSRSGSDGNGGTTDGAPLKSLGKLASLDLGPGDTVCFARGAEWRGQLEFKGNGTEGKPIRLAAYGRGPRPEFLGSIRPTAWEHHAGEVHTLKVPRRQIIGDKEVNAVFALREGRTPLPIPRRRSGIPTERGQCFYDMKSETLYVITPDGGPPSSHALEVPVISPTLHLRDRSWIEISDLAFAFGNRTQVIFRKCRDVSFRNCAVVYMGGKNPNVSVTDHCERVHIAGCFVYWSANNGIKFNQGSTNCKVTGCTIVKLLSNDGITCHDGPPNECGPHIVAEDNVVGLCPENALDITSGDYHEFRRNICYMNNEPGIAIGHGADHILIENNISFSNKREGIKMGSNPKEDGRGNIRVVGNLFYDNGYPGIGIQAKHSKVYHNTVVNSRNRAAVRISEEAEGSEIANNLIVTLDPAIRQSSLAFMAGDPIRFKVKVAANMFFNVARPDGKVIHTNQGAFTPDEFAARYGTGQGGFVAMPAFVSDSDRNFSLAAASPAVDAGADLGVPFKGRAPDIGWKELGAEGTAPAYPPFLIGDGENDEAEILYMWGKTDVAPKRKDWRMPVAGVKPRETFERAMRHESAAEYVQALIGYNAVASFASDRADGAKAAERMAHLLRQERVQAALHRAEVEDAISKAEEYAKKPGLAIHYVELAAALAGGDPRYTARIAPLAAEIGKRPSATGRR